MESINFLKRNKRLVEFVSPAIQRLPGRQILSEGPLYRTQRMSPVQKRR